MGIGRVKVSFVTTRALSIYRICISLNNLSRNSFSSVFSSRASKTVLKVEYQSNLILRLIKLWYLICYWYILFPSNTRIEVHQVDKYVHNQRTILECIWSFLLDLIKLSNNLVLKISQISNICLLSTFSKLCE